MRATLPHAHSGAGVMDIGDFDDVQRMMEAFGDEMLRSVLRHAEAGQFSPRS